MCVCVCVCVCDVWVCCVTVGLCVHKCVCMCVQCTLLLVHVRVGVVCDFHTVSTNCEQAPEDAPWTGSRASVLAKEQTKSGTLTLFGGSLFFNVDLRISTMLRSFKMVALFATASG